VQGFTASAGNTFKACGTCAAGTSRKPQHSAKIFVREQYPEGEISNILDKAAISSILIYLINKE
jgi:hypothetical protein